MHKRLLKITIFLLFLLSSILVNAQFKVIGYYPTWTGTSSINNIQFDKLTHINYAFAIPNNDGSLREINTKNDSTKFKTLISNAHANNVKVLISIGGIFGSGSFPTIGASSSLRTTFTVKVMEMVEAFNLDGADIDWEFPTNATESANCVLLMKEISDSLHKYNKLVTMAINPFGDYADAIYSEIFDYVDFLNIMAYDGGSPHSSMGMATQAIAYWKTRELAKEKIILGVPFYGRNTVGIVAYRTLVAADELAPYTDNISYNGNQTNYNGVTTIKNKTKYALNNAGGIMIWELTNDTNDWTSLLRAIHSEVVLATSTSDKISASEFKLYPNPAQEHIQFEFNSNLTNSISQMYISDLSGKKVMDIQTTHTPIDITTLEDGFYIVTLISGDKSGQQKLIISRK